MVDIAPFVCNFNSCQALDEGAGKIEPKRDDGVAGGVDIAPHTIALNRRHALAEIPRIIILCRDDNDAIFFEAIFPMLFKSFVFLILVADEFAHSDLVAFVVISHFGVGFYSCFI